MSASELSGIQGIEEWVRSSGRRTLSGQGEWSWAQSATDHNNTHKSSNNNSLWVRPVIGISQHYCNIIIDNICQAEQEQAGEIIRHLDSKLYFWPDENNLTPIFTELASF